MILNMNDFKNCQIYNKKYIEPSKFILFTKPNCPYCEEAKQRIYQSKKYTGTVELIDFYTAREICTKILNGLGVDEIYLPAIFAVDATGKTWYLPIEEWRLDLTSILYPPIGVKFFKNLTNGFMPAKL